jgi:hypothetical protein
MKQYSDTHVEVYFKDGVPVTADDDSEVPKLLFKKDSEMVIAAVENLVFDTHHDLDIKDVPSDLRCSFAGGCLYTIVAPGLT